MLIHMCGIAGFWKTKRSSEDPLETLNRMGVALSHRGPDDSGTFYDPATGIALAFRRLSILDLSSQGHQPMVSASGRYVIIFNGEVYNFQEIKAELGERAWRGHSDTEVMLAAIERWGLDSAVRRFVGMFAIALWDREERRLFLVRDRLGIKPVYYGKVAESFVFASELKAIQQCPDFQGELDRDALALYMRHDYIPAPHCIYQGLHKLPPGYILALSSGVSCPELHSYWSAREVAKEGVKSRLSISDAEAIEQLEQKLLEAVRLRMLADVSVGTFLSGGIDSSTVVALMQAQSARPVKTFTIGFHEDEFNEADHAKKVAAHLGTEHTELYLTPQDARDVVPLLPSMCDEPFADSSQIPTFLVSKLARRSVTVSLSGDGGDELFGGYNRYLLARSIWNSIERIPKTVRKTAARLMQSVSPNAIDHIFRLLRPVMPRRMWLSTPGDKAHKFADLLAVGSQEAIYHRLLSHWECPSKIVLNSSEPRTVFDSIAESAWLPDIEEVMMLTDLLNYLPDDILTKVDRASMAVSLEARVPLLDHRVVEFAWRLPLHLKIRNKTSKWILRQVLYKYIPKELMERPKMGFGVPIGSWLGGPLREWAEDLLSVEKLGRHELLNVAEIRNKWTEHLSGSRNWQYLLWDVLVFQDWFYAANRRVTTESFSGTQPSQLLRQ